MCLEGHALIRWHQLMLTLVMRCLFACPIMLLAHPSLDGEGDRACMSSCAFMRYNTAFPVESWTQLSMWLSGPEIHLISLTSVEPSSWTKLALHFQLSEVPDWLLFKWKCSLQFGKKHSHILSLSRKHPLKQFHFVTVFSKSSFCCKEREWSANRQT